MGRDSLLKKEFKVSDVERIRNIVNGAYTKGTKTMIGYDGNSTGYGEHGEGEVWEEGGKQWTVEDGLKVPVLKFGKAREACRIPISCPKCGKRMDTRLDKKIFPIHGMCFDCLVKFEDDLKRAGLYEQYERDILSGNIQSFVSSLRDRVQALERSSKVQITTDEGTVEDWGKVSREMIKGLEEWSSMLLEHVNYLCKSKDS